MKKQLRLTNRIHLLGTIKGNALDKLNKSDEAKKPNKAIEIDPQYSAAWKNKGLALYNLNKYEEAIKAYDKAIEINPQDSAAWYNRGCIYSVINNKDQSIFNFEKAIDFDSSYKEKAKKDDDFKGLWKTNNLRNLLKKLIFL